VHQLASDPRTEIEEPGWERTMVEQETIGGALNTSFD
jgi:hypothetical protein